MSSGSGIRFGAAVVWFAVVAFLVLFAVSASKPLHLDDMDFPAAAEATAHTGQPVYYRGEENPNHIGLFHPPLYIYLLASWFKLLGAGAAQARLFGASCALLHVMCILLLVQTLFGSDYARRSAPWICLLFLLNSYTIQTAAITDIDSTIYGPLILIFLWTILRLSWRRGIWRTDRVSPLEFICAILALTLCFWAKLTTVWLVLPFIVLFLVGRFGWVRAALLGALVVTSGIGVFLATYAIFGKLTHLDIGYTFSFTLESLKHRGSSGGVGVRSWFADRIGNLKFMAPFMANWTGLTPWAGLIAGIVYGSWRWAHRKDHQSLHATLLLVLAASSTLYYCGQTTTFGGAPFKYTYVYWGVAIAAIVVLALPPESFEHTPVPALSWGRVPIFVGLWVGCALAGLAFIRDTVLLEESNRLSFSSVLFLPLIVFLLGLVVRARGRIFAGETLAACGLIVYGGFQAGVAVYQNSQEYATTYDYGQRGFPDAVNFVTANTGPNDVIESMKDVGYAAHRRYFENYGALYGDKQEGAKLIDWAASGRAKLSIFTEGRGQDQLVINPLLRDWFTGRCRLLGSFGNYRVYGECK